MKWPRISTLRTDVRQSCLRVGKSILGAAVAATAPFIAPAARHGIGSGTCLRHGFLPVPVHFYQPVPDVADLVDRDVFATRSDMPGVAFSSRRQVELLTSLGEEFGEECRWAATVPANSAESGYFTENGAFSFGCAASTHCVIRRFKPKIVLEIGSGQSSTIIAQALESNLAEGGVRARHCVIDPYPSPGLARRGSYPKELTTSRVELVDPHRFDALTAGDILFVDSGHTVRIGGDVNFLFLEVIPRLAPGVLVHVHDIPLPWDYPRAYATRQGLRFFWTESYLLQAFLAFNSAFEVMLAMSYLMTEERGAFQSAFPHYDPDAHRAVSGSFWMRRVGGHDTTACEAL